MAIILEGKTRCVICDQTIESIDEAIAFGPLAPNSLGKFHQFNDAAVHSWCLSEFESKDELLAKADTYVKASSPPRVCAVCGQEIKEQRDHIFVPDLTDPEIEVPYVLKQLHKSCLDHSSQKAVMVDRIKQLKATGRWEDQYIDYVLSEIAAGIAVFH